MAAIDGRGGDTKREDKGDEGGKQKGRPNTAAAETRKEKTRATKEGTWGGRPKTAATETKEEEKKEGEKEKGNGWRKGSKETKKGCKGQLYALDLCNLVGMTRFERATSRPPDVYSTN